MSEDAQPEAEAKGEALPEAQPPKETKPLPNGVPDEEPQPGKEPNWFEKRIEQATKSAASEVLKSLGVESLDAAKERLSELQKLKDEQLTEQERTAKQLEELKPQAQRAVALEKSLSGYAEQAVSKLTAEQAEAVKGIAGDDPARILDTITKLTPTWKAAAPAAPEAKPEPKDTAPQGGPPEAGNQSPVDYSAEYERLKKTNPFEASDLLRAHPEILSAGG